MTPLDRLMYATGILCLALIGAPILLLLAAVFCELAGGILEALT